jgi:hypothetical protein
LSSVPKIATLNTDTLLAAISKTAENANTFKNLLILIIFYPAPNK